MKFKKPEHNSGGLLVKLLRGLLTSRGIDSKLVNLVAHKKLKLTDKDYVRLKSLLVSGSISIKSFLWILGVFLDVKSIQIRITIEDKYGNIDEAHISSGLEDEVDDV